MHICAKLKGAKMRPKKTRWVKCKPDQRCFRPKCKSLKELEGVILSIDEFEAVSVCVRDTLAQFLESRLR